MEFSILNLCSLQLYQQIKQNYKKTRLVLLQFIFMVALQAIFINWLG